MDIYNGIGLTGDDFLVHQCPFFLPMPKIKVDYCFLVTYKLAIRTQAKIMFRVKINNFIM